jgi:hypothetical protein
MWYRSLVLLILLLAIQCYLHSYDFNCFFSVLAAKNLGEPAYSNFLDHTYLGDRKTTIREYLDTTGAGVMEEEPPESLKSRYSG